MEVIYFDNNATTKINSEVLRKMNDAYTWPINSSATHELGREGLKLTEEARQNLKDFLNAENYEVTFTGSGTEASNLALFGNKFNEIFFSEIEHVSVFNCRPKLEEIFEVETLPNGLIDIADLEAKLNLTKNSNFLVSIMLANNETGAIQPVEEIAKLVHSKGGLIHSDIVQAAGKIPVDLEKLNVDFASISAHKFNGPQGVGALLRRKGLDIDPIIFGGSQEGYKRAGTLNVAGIVGFGEACKLAVNNLNGHKEVEILRDLLENELTKVAGENVKIFSQGINRLPNTSFISIKNASAETQLINFDLNKICVSGGTTCSAGFTKESRVLKAMQVESKFLQGAVRVSLGIENTKEEVEKFIKVWTEFYQRTKN